MVLETSFPPDLRVENEIDALLNAGHNVTIVAGFRKKLARHAYYNNARIIRVFIPIFIYKSSIGALNFPFYFNFWYKKLRKILLEDKYDALHIHDLPLTSVVLKLRSKLNLSYKITLDLHENYPDMLKIAKHTNTFLGSLFFNYQQWLAYESKMIQAVDYIVTVVDEMKERITSLGVNPNKVIVVSNTFNRDKFPTPQRKSSSDDFILFYGGGVTIDRGLQFVIPALPLLEKKIKNIKLWIVGDGSYLSELKEIARKNKCEHLINFYGHKAFTELLLLLAQANVALIPHLKSPQTESGLPHKLFQYMITGIPIVASNCSPFIRILGETKAGLIYQYDKSEDLAEKIIRLSEDNNLQEELTTRAESVLLKDYLWDYDAARLVKIYQADTSL